MVLAHLLTPRADTQEQIAARPEAWTPGAGFMRKTQSGETVSPAKSMTISTYFACIRNIAEDIGLMPVELYNRAADGSKTKATEHRVYDMLRYSPNPEMSSSTLRELVTGWAPSWGNGYCEIERDRANRPVNLWPIHPSRCWLHRVDGEIVLDVHNDDGTFVRLEYNNVLHLRGFGDDPMGGLSIARLAAESVGVALAAQSYGAAFFGNGAHASVLLMHPGKLDEGAIARLRDSWKKRLTGGNKNGVAVIEEGMKVERMSVPPEEAQFLQTRQFQVAEIARWFRMPPHMVQDLSKATFSNIEHQSIEYLTRTLGPWMNRWENEIELKLLDINERKKLDVKHNDKALLRGDFKSRMEGYRIGIAAGVMRPNQARREEDWDPDPSPAAEKLYMQGAMMTIDQIAEGKGGQPQKEEKPEDENSEPVKEKQTDNENENSNDN